MAVLVRGMKQLNHWIAQEGPTAEKHRGWLHPTIVVVIHYCAVAIISFGMHDLLRNGSGKALLEECAFENVELRNKVATFCLFYVFTMQGVRLYALGNKQAVLYEANWLCTVTLVMGPLGLYWNRPIIASAYCVVIGVDQLLWYVDLLGYSLR